MKSQITGRERVQVLREVTNQKAKDNFDRFFEGLRAQRRHRISQENRVNIFLSVLEFLILVYVSTCAWLGHWRIP